MRAGIGAALIAMAAVTAGCSSGSSHNGPQAAVDGFLTGLAKHDKAAACSHYTPKVRTVCEKNLPANATVQGAGVGNSIVVGDRAIVVVVADKLCLGSDCLTNHDPAKGLPTSDAGFAAAYKEVLASNAKDPRVPLININGSWYINTSS